MAYLAETLVERSLYLSGIVSRQLQTPTGNQISDGLQLLNALLNYKQIETDLIPYETYIELNTVSNQEYYFLPNIASVELGTFNIGPVRYPMDFTSRQNYFGSSRVDNIDTLPFNWNFNRGEGGGTLSLYFLPSSVWSLKLMVKFFLSDVVLTDDLTNIFAPLASGFVSSITLDQPGSGYTSPPTVTISGGNGTGAEAFASVFNGSVANIYLINAGSYYSEVPTVTLTGGGGSGASATANIANYTFLQTNNAGYDSSYIEYLRYALAEYMCSEYGVIFNPQSEAILRKLETKLMYVSPPDVTMRKSSILAEGTGINYGDVNIGRGWRPS